jgi:hypothetical protein
MLQLRRLDHVEQCDPAARMRRAPRGIMDGNLKFLALVDNDEENTLVRSL